MGRVATTLRLSHTYLGSGKPQMSISQTDHLRPAELKTPDQFRTCGGNVGSMTCVFVFGGKGEEIEQE